MKIGVLGLGSWPLALARTLNDNGHDVLMWSAIEEEVEEFNSKHTASKYINDIVFEDNMKATASLEELCNYSSIILIGIPTKFYRNILVDINSKLNDEKIFINVSKCIEPWTHMIMSEIISEENSDENITDIVN